MAAPVTIRRLPATLVFAGLIVGGLAVDTPPSVADEVGISYPVRVQISGGAAPTAVAAGLLNGDLRTDLVALNSSSSKVSILLGFDGVGFDRRYEFATGGNPTALKLSDLNADGYLDIVTTNDATMSVLLGDGSGRFFAKPAVEVSASALAIGDVDGDTVPDIVAANRSGNTVSVLLGDGTGGFALPGPFVTNDYPDAIALADLDGNGALDLVTVGEGEAATPGGASVLLGDGLGGFGPPTRFSSGAPPTAVAAADIDADGDVDLVTANYADSTMSVLLGDGAGNLGAPTTRGTDAGPSAIAIADLDGDGPFDVVTTNSVGNSVSTFRGDGAGGFGAGVQTEVASFPRSIAVADLLGDDHLELAVATAGIDMLLRTVPSAPTMARNAQAGYGQATISWSAPALAAPPVTGYTLTPYIGYYALPPVTFASVATSQTITGLTNGVTYRFRVAAINAIGTGPMSRVSNPVTPQVVVPSAPTMLLNATPGNADATVSWTPPTSDGGSPVISYTLRWYIGYFPAGSRVVDSSVTTATTSSLSNGTTYRFRVTARTAIGESQSSKVSNPVTPSASP